MIREDLTCLENPDPVGMKFYDPSGKPYPSGCSTAWASKSATTRASTAARAASGIFISATRTTARASTSTRSPEIASHYASQGIATPSFPA